MNDKTMRNMVLANALRNSRAPPTNCRVLTVLVFPEILLPITECTRTHCFKSNYCEIFKRKRNYFELSRAYCLLQQATSLAECNIDVQCIVPHHELI